jgi:hypothetical protein
MTPKQCCKISDAALGGRGGGASYFIRVVQWKEKAHYVVVDMTWTFILKKSKHLFSGKHFTARVRLIYFWGSNKKQRSTPLTFKTV